MAGLDPKPRDHRRATEMKQRVGRANCRAGRRGRKAGGGSPVAGLGLEKGREARTEWLGAPTPGEGELAQSCPKQESGLGVRDLVLFRFRWVPQGRYFPSASQMSGGKPERGGFSKQRMLDKHLLRTYPRCQARLQELGVWT